MEIFDWIRDQFIARPLPVVVADPHVPACETVAVHLRCPDCLRRVPRRFVRGWHWWWLTSLDDDRFVHVTLPRGDEPVDLQLRLKPGRYRLGVGRGRSAIRRTFHVPREG